MPGKHEIAVDKPGYTAAPQPVEIVGDRETRLKFVLNTAEHTSQPPADPYLIVRSRAGAKVLVDGVEIGLVQPDGTYSFKTTPGRHHVELRLPDYIPWTSDITARPGNVVLPVELKEAPKPLPAILSFTSVASEIQEGQSTELKWQTQNATDVILEGVGSVGPNDSKTVSPAHTTTYTLIAKGAGREIRSSATVKVTSVPKPAISTFEPGADRIQAGQSTKLIWATQNASDVSITPDIGPVESNSFRIVRPEKTTQYTLTAKGPGGTDTKTTQITVDPKPVATPAVAAIPRPAPPPVPAAEDPDIKAVIDTIQVRLANAYNSRSVAEVKKVWKLSKSEEKDFKEHLEDKGLRAITAVIKCESPRVNGNAAECVCTQVLTVNRGGDLEPGDPAKLRYRLAKEDNRWYIVTATKSK
jgi:PKD repeat protein